MEKLIHALKVIAWYDAEQGYITVGQLAQQVEVSEATARRYIKAMLEQGVVQWRNRGEYALDRRDDFGRMLAAMYGWGEDQNARSIPF